MILDILATIVLLYWGLQGANLTMKTWNDGYAPLWVLVAGLLTAALIVPLAAVWL